MTDEARETDVEGEVPAAWYLELKAENARLRALLLRAEEIERLGRETELFLFEWPINGSGYADDTEAKEDMADLRRRWLKVLAIPEETKEAGEAT